MRLERLIAATLLVPTLAAAAPPGPKAVERCIEASEHAQEAREHGHFAEAKRSLEVCLDASCPAVIRRDCADARTSLESRQPTLVVRVLDVRGAVVDAAVRVDGAVLADDARGRALPVDPGPHEVSVQHAGGVVRRTITATEGQNPQTVDLVLPGAAPLAPIVPPRSAAPSRGPTTGTWVATVGFGVVAVAGVATWAGLGLTTNGDYDALQDRCAPDCPRSDTDALARRYQIADVALGLGLGALVVSAAVLVFGPRRHVAPSAALGGPTLRF